MPIPNPYGFVPLEDKETQRVWWLEAENNIASYRPDRYSGRITCVLHPETPIFVHGQEQQGKKRRGFFQIAGRPGIPASSLKGVIRSIYEIVTDGCLSSLSQEYRGGRGSIQINKRLPSAYLPCHDLKVLCPACLLFGMVEQNISGEQQARGLAGRLSFSDAKPIRVNAQWRNMPAAGGGPQPRHGTFYFQRQGEGGVLGRKLYYHHRDYEETLLLYGDGGRPGLMQVEMHSGDFRFDIDFVNLTETELNYLCYTLLLEDTIRHHLAYGKAYGLGSARIRIQNIDLLRGPGQTAVTRFLSLSPEKTPSIDANVHAGLGKKQWLKRSDGGKAYTEFSRILAWPGVDLYQYPTYQWFRHTAGSGDVTLAEYQEGIRTKARRTPPPAPTPPQSSAEADEIRAKLMRRLGLDKK